MAWIAKLKSRDFVELTIGYALILLAEWTPDSVQRLLFWFTLAWVIVMTILARQSARTLGFRPLNAWRSIWIVAVALPFAALAVWIAMQLHTLHAFSFGTLVGSRFRGYLLWTFLQQFMLQDYFLFRLLRLLSSKRAAVLTAAILFAGAHIPNLLLMVATLLWGVASCTLFLRYRDLYSLGIAQGILGICIAVTVPSPIHHEMRVGLGYFRYRQQVQPVHRSQIDRIVSTDAWVIADATSRRLARQALP